MPWRETRDPYRILVSEIMLQQTQVDRVREKYKEFLNRFPVVEDLAHASLGDVLRVWSGLGYNRRAKYLHQAVVTVHESDLSFPQTMEGLTSLPGIGRSTAAGVMAFAWNFPEPMIDTNVRRVLNRVFFPLEKKTDQELYLFAKSIIPKGKGRMWNYALLDLAAMKCTARNHAHDCPLMILHGKLVEHFPKKKHVRFEDTDRYARGRIIAELRRVHEGLPLKSLSQYAQRSIQKTQTLLQKLLSEHLIVKEKSFYKLPKMCGIIDG